MVIAASRKSAYISVEKGDVKKLGFHILSNFIYLNPDLLINKFDFFS